LLRWPAALPSTPLVILAPAVLAIAACSTLEPYRPAGAEADMAAIQDDRFRMGALEYVRILSVDRERIDSESRDLPIGQSAAGGVSPDHEDDWIPLQPGLRKLEVEVCKFAPGFLDVLALSGWHCGHTVLRLTCEPGSLYRLRGTVDKKEDRATFWIEDAVSGDTVVSTVEIPVDNL
jgi:hypothetical protein